MNVAAVLDSAKDAFYALTASCCRQGTSFHSLESAIARSPASGPADALVKLNGRNFKILQLLGEGGFSYVRDSLPPWTPTRTFQSVDPAPS